MNPIAVRVENVGKLYRLGEHTRPKAALSDFASRFRKWIGPAGAGSAEGDARDAKTDYIWALKDVTFDVQRGDSVGIIGRNGAGKSTLVKIISQITRPTTGRVEIHGRVSALLGVGAGFHPDMTGRENIYMNGSMLGISKQQIERKFDEIVAFSEIEKFIDTPVKRYSKGMRTRLSVSVAAHLDPDILIVDEVLAVGDIRFRDKCMDKINAAVKEGTTLLFISHSIARINRLCNKAILLRDGRLVTMGPPEEVIKEYLDVDVKDGPLSDDESGAGEVREVLRAIESEDQGAPTPTSDPACGNIQHVSIIGLHDGQPNEEVLVHQDSRIRIQFQLLKKDVQISAGADFYVGDQLAFGTRQLPQAIHAPGSYDLVMRLPRDLLSELVYKVNVSVSVFQNNAREVVKRHNALKFKPLDVRDKSHLPISIRNMNPGIVSPVLTWSVIGPLES
jgi:ABC-type polysaccharide/polyol phosphate transport system ATPase subunit